MQHLTYGQQFGSSGYSISTLINRGVVTNTTIYCGVQKTKDKTNFNN
ncbi:hypothetical protein BMS3Bbin03_02181 [bacterium BMS3Bbin03]|nr:hypothetical protein BMS3Bbin03_02181 [bacterium BMS3Bbin03]